MATRKKTRTGNKIMIGVGGFITVATAFVLLADLPAKVDPFVHTTAEAELEHEELNGNMMAAEQTQAGFNAYTLRNLLEQEIAILKLQIEVEQDEEEKEHLKEELAEKEAFIRKLKEEEHKQLLKGDHDV